MKTFGILTRRNCKLFFKDKGMFFTSLITPLILLVLYGTFLANVYKDSFNSVLPKTFKISEKLINGTVGGELFSSLLAVSCVTVSFCCNMLMVQDKASGARIDLTISPIKKSILALSYYTATVISTLIVSFTATAACLIYMLNVGWYLSLSDILLIMLDVLLLVLFGTSLSSIINVFLSSQGQISAVGTIVSAGYGFVCGAYMPISSFSETLQKVISFLPGTYGTSLIRNHALSGVFAEMKNVGFPKEVISGIKDSIDCNLYFFGNKVSQLQMYCVLLLSTAVLVGIYVLLNIMHSKKTN